MKRYLLLVMISLICLITNAQENIQNDILRSIVERVHYLNDYISFIADKSNSIETRLYYKKEVLNMFIGKGYPYEEDGIHKDGVKIMISSINNTNTHTKLVRQYFNGLVNLTYGEVLIECSQSTDMKVDDIQKIDDEHFVCFYYYYQAFRGQNNGKTIYKDITRKKIKCYVERQETEDGFEYSVLFGDLYAVETK